MFVLRINITYNTTRT